MADTLTAKYTKIESTSAVAVTTAGSWTTTVLSLSICNITSTDITFDMYVTDNSNSNSAYYIHEDQSLPGPSTFMHDSKIVLEANDVVYIHTSANVATTVVASVLKQT